jgi:hypothetical protein
VRTRPPFLVEGLATVVVVIGMAVAPLPILVLRFAAQLVELAMGLVLCLFPLQIETVLVVVPIVVVLVFAVIDPVVVVVVVPVLKRQSSKANWCSKGRH